MNTNSAVTDSNLSPQERKRILRVLESNWQAEMRGREGAVEECRHPYLVGHWGGNDSR